MTEDEEAMVLNAIQKEGQHRSYYNCILRTHSLQADVENCTRHWVNSCSNPEDADLFRTYLEERYARDEWQKPLKASNEGWHGRCDEFISAEDQAFVWEREKDWAEAAGFA